MSAAVTTTRLRITWPVPLVIGSLVVLGAVILALFAPWIAPYDPILQNTANTLQGPSFAHPFGTDNFGRDIFSRVIWGTRIDLQMGSSASFSPSSSAR